MGTERGDRQVGEKNEEEGLAAGSVFKKRP
jgi:hypothetical protein